MARNTLFIVPLLFLSSCCWFAKRSCFPNCPPPTIVKVEKTCELPPSLKLPAVKRFEENCPEDSACFNSVNAGLLAVREAAMKNWIREAKERCSNTKESN